MGSMPDSKIVDKNVDDVDPGSPDLSDELIVQSAVKEKFFRNQI